MSLRALSRIALALAAASLPACWSPHTPDTVHTYRQSDREQRIDAMLREYRTRIDELNDRAGKAAESARNEARRAVDDLKAKHRTASERLQQLRNATNTAWGDVNAKLQESLDDLKKAFDSAQGAPHP